MENPVAFLSVLAWLVGPIALFLVFQLTRRVERLEGELDAIRRRKPVAPPPALPIPPPVVIPNPTSQDLVTGTKSPTAVVLDEAFPSKPSTPGILPITPVAYVDAPPTVPLAPKVDNIPIPGNFASLPEDIAPVSPDNAPNATETAAGQRWLAYAGGALLVIGLALLVKVAVDRGWLGHLIPPTARVLLVAATGLGLCAFGWHRSRRSPTPVSQALTGVGLAGMYLATMAARSPALGIVPEPLLDAGGAFALLGVVSALGLVVAVTVNSPAVALLSLFGGQLSLLVAPDSGARHGLLIHQVLVAWGVLGAASWCAWPWVARISVLSAFAAALLWWNLRGPGPAPDFTTVGWLAALGLPMTLLGWRPWISRAAQPSWSLSLGLAGLVWFLTQATVLLRDPAPVGLAVLAGSIGVLGLFLWHQSRCRTPGDGPTQAIGLVIAATATALVILALVPTDAQAAAWLVEALAVLTIPRALGTGLPPVMRLTAGSLLVLGSAATLEVVFRSRPDNVWLPPFLAMLTAALVYGILARRWGQEALEHEEDALEHALGRLALVVWPLALGAGGLLLVRDLPLSGSNNAAILAAAGWLTATLGAVAMGQSGTGRLGRLAILMPLGATGISALVAMFTRSGGLPVVNLPFVLVSGAIIAVACTGKAGSATRNLERWCWGGGAWLLVSVEASTWCLKNIDDRTIARAAAMTSVTALWALAGFAFLAWGLWRDQRTLRLIGLTAFAAAGGKLLLIDLNGHDAGIRVAAFLGLGVLFLSGSYLYQRWGRNRPGGPAGSR